MAGWYRAVAAMVAVPLVTTACVFGGSGGATGTAERAPKTTTLSLSANASVLITSTPEDSAVKVARVRPFPASIVLEPGEVVELDADAFGSAGEPLSEIDFVWAVADPRAGAIRQERRFQAGSTPGVFDNAVTVTGTQNTPRGSSSPARLSRSSSQVRRCLRT